MGLTDTNVHYFIMIANVIYPSQNIHMSTCAKLHPKDILGKLAMSDFL